MGKSKTETNYQQRIKSLVDSYNDWVVNSQLLDDGKMTQNLYPYTNIFTPIQVNGIKIKNRLMMGPMGNISMAEETGRPNSKMIKYFIERAKGGVGLISSGLIPVSHGIDPSVTELGELTYFPRIDRSRTTWAGWRDIAEGVHAYGARFFIQLTAGLGRVGSPECLVHKFKFPISASWNKNFYIPQVPCRPASDRMLKKIIHNAGQAAADAKAQLIDGVYLHGHEGYFLEQMTNTAFNRRPFGRFANWQNFGLDMVKEIRNRCGPRYPIMYRIDLSLVLNETYGKRMDTESSLKKYKNERTVDQTLEYMKNLVKAGVDIFDVDLGSYDNWWLPHPPESMPPGCFLEVSKICKEYFAQNGIKSNAGLEVPIVAVGKLGYPDLAEKALRDKQCDMVMLARPLLADPQWPNKVYSGKVSEICPCIGDQEGCINEFVNGGHPQCTVNPRTGLEDMIENDLIMAKIPKKIAVVGGGPAGIYAACTAAKRGHEVTLFEKQAELGGMTIPGSLAKIKFDILNYRKYLNNLVPKVGSSTKLTVKLNSPVTVDQLKKEKFDSVVVAVGSKQIAPPIEGIKGSNVVQGLDLLKNPALADKANSVVIVGGGMVGCEIAHYLAYEKNKKVTVIEMLPQFMAASCTANRGHLIHALEAKGVQLMNCTKLLAVESTGVKVSQNVSSTVPNQYCTWTPVLPENIPNPMAKPIKIKEEIKVLPADLVVLSMGGKPDDALYEACVKEHIAPEIFNIGDSFSVGKIFEATKAGFNLGNNL